MQNPRFIKAAIIAVLLVGFWSYLTSPDHKYRLTFDVDTPHGVVSASGVMAVYFDGFSIGPIGGGVGMKGEAIFLDLGEGRNVIAVLAHGRDGSDEDGMSRLAMKAFAAAGQKVPFRDVKRLNGTVPVRGDLIPTLVTFADLNDPLTARVVSPGNFEANFGPGYRLQNVSLEMVDFWPLNPERIFGQLLKPEIEKKVPFLVTHRDELRKVSRNMPPRFQSQFHLFERR